MDDEKAALEEFKKCYATARKKEDGTIEVRIPELIQGEVELDPDTLDEFGEGIYIINDYEVVSRGEFDTESKQQFREMGYAV